MNKFIFLVVLLLPNILFAAEAPHVSLQREWDKSMYVLTGSEQKKAIIALSKQAESLMKQHQNDASVYAWAGIILSTEAGLYKINVIKALAKAKEAKAVFEKAKELQADVLDGAIYTSLGSLYAEVPPFPIGFGDKKLAKEYLLQGLALNPKGVESHFFYAKYLFAEKKYKQSLQEFEQALQAPDRPDRLIADEGRKKEVQEWIVKTKKKLS